MAFGGLSMVLCLVPAVINGVNGNWRPRTEAITCIVMVDAFVKPSNDLDGWRAPNGSGKCVDGNRKNIGRYQAQSLEQIVPFTREKKFSHPSIMWDNRGNGALNDQEQGLRSPYSGDYSQGKPFTLVNGKGPSNFQIPPPNRKRKIFGPHEREECKAYAASDAFPDSVVCQ